MIKGHHYSLDSPHIEDQWLSEENPSEFFHVFYTQLSSRDCEAYSSTIFNHMLDDCIRNFCFTRATYGKDNRIRGILIIRDKLIRDELLADDLAHCQTQQGTLKIAPMLAMSDARRAAIIRRWLAGQNAPMPSREALVRIWQEVALAREDASPLFTFGRV